MTPQAKVIKTIPVNPYPKYIRDEASGQVFEVERHRLFNEGYEACKQDLIKVFETTESLAKDLTAELAEIRKIRKELENGNGN